MKPRPLRVDAHAHGHDPTAPAFAARPDDQPLYYGFPVLDHSVVDGFRLGVITDFAEQVANEGDAFVVAPDGSRAGLVWETDVNVPYVEEVLPPDESRWGVWAVGVRHPLRADSDATAFLREALPLLRPKWEEWSVLQIAHGSTDR